MTDVELNRRAERAGGIAGFLFVAGVLFQNGVLLAGAPLPGATLDVVAEFYRAGGTRVALACGWVALNLPLLLIFGAAVRGRLSGDALSRLWATVGFGGVILLAAAFSATTWLQSTLVARVDVLVASGHLSLVWDLHTAAFTASGTALGVTLVGFSLGALQTGLVPRSVAWLGLAGAGSLITSGFLTAWSVSGGVGIFFQLGGFVTWVVWLVSASWRFVRPGGQTTAQGA